LSTLCDQLLNFVDHRVPGLRGERRHAGAPGTTGRPADNIFSVTLTAAGVTFFLIAVTAKPGGTTAALSAAIAAMAGPMVLA
jgi:hypothetical protein